MTSVLSKLLPGLPAIRIEEVEDLSPSQRVGWLRFLRRRLRAHYPDGTASDPFEYDAIHRAALDAATIAAHYVGADGRRHVYLRSAVRPPLLLREPWRDSGREPTVGLWELPAGLIDEQDLGAPDRAQAAAQRELAEELGFVVARDALRRLGPGIFPAPGVIGEQLFFYEVEVDPSQRGEPGLDGSALERGGLVVAIPLDAALEMCAAGESVDGKTELGLRRLEERLR